MKKLIKIGCVNITPGPSWKPKPKLPEYTQSNNVFGECVDFATTSASPRIAGDNQGEGKNAQKNKHGNTK